MIACVEAGVTGYVTRDESLDNLVAAVKARFEAMSSALPIWPAVSSVDSLSWLLIDTGWT